MGNPPTFLGVLSAALVAGSIIASLPCDAGYGLSADSRHGFCRSRLGVAMSVSRHSESDTTHDPR